MTLQEQIEGWNKRHEMSLILGCYNKEMDEAKEIIRKQSEMLKVAKEGLSKLACLGNEPCLGNSEGNMIARKALATIEGMER